MQSKVGFEGSVSWKRTSTTAPAGFAIPGAIEILEPHGAVSARAFLDRLSIVAPHTAMLPLRPSLIYLFVFAYRSIVTSTSIKKILLRTFLKKFLNEKVKIYMWNSRIYATSEKSITFLMSCIQLRP